MDAASDRTYHEASDEVLTAMAHPLRRRLLDVLAIEGAATASVLAERTGQRVGNVSHHLKVLDEAGLILEDPALARDRRERWWRRVEGGTSWATPGPDAAASRQAIAGAAEAVNLDGHVARVRAWQAERDDAEWIHAAFASDTWMALTAAELATVSEEVNTIFRRWGNRDVPDDGQERRSVLVFAHGVPATP